MLLQTRTLAVVSVALLLGVASGEGQFDEASGALSGTQRAWNPAAGSAIAAGSPLFEASLAPTTAVARDSGTSRQTIRGRSSFAPEANRQLFTAFFIALSAIGVSGLALRYLARLPAAGSTQGAGSRANRTRDGSVESDDEPASYGHRSEVPTAPPVSASPPAVTPPAAATAAVASKPLVIGADDAAGAAEEMERLARRLEAARDSFRRGLDTVRDEASALARSGGPVLAPWGASIWERWDEASTDPAGVPDRGIRVGDLTLFADDEGADVWTVPAVVAPARWGAVVVEGHATEIERVRWAIVGWCVRYIASMGPGRVGVAWFEEGAANGVPAAWRAPPGSSLTEWFERWTAGLAQAQQTGVRWVVVGLGSEADAVPNLGWWVADCAEVSLSSGVALWLAPSRRVEVVSTEMLHVVRAPGNPGRYRVSGEALGRHEVLWQEPPPTDLVQRFAAWAAPADGASHYAGVGSVKPVPEAAETTPITPAATADRDRAAPPVSVAARLRGLLAVPAPTMPRLVLGRDADGLPVEFALDAPLQLRGGTAEEAAAHLATQVLEIACQTHANAWEFVVLDFSDDAVVADRFDAILDVTPHLIEYTEGVGAHLKLDAIIERRSQPDDELPDITLVVLAHPTRPLPDGLEALLRGATESRVHLLVWQATSGLSDANLQTGEAVLTLDAPTDLRVVGLPARPLQLDQPLAAEDAASLAGALQQARA